MLEKFLPKKTREIVELQNQAGTNHFSSHEIVLILGLILLLALVLFFWAAYVRKPKPDSSASTQILTSKIPRARRKKGDRRRWKKRNPTLSETGGLPPRKNDAFLSE